MLNLTISLFVHCRHIHTSALFSFFSNKLATLHIAARRSYLISTYIPTKYGHLRGGRLVSVELARYVDEFGETDSQEPIHDDSDDAASIDIEASIVWLVENTVKRYDEDPTEVVDETNKWRLWIGAEHEEDDTEGEKRSDNAKNVPDGARHDDTICFDDGFFGLVAAPWFWHGCLCGCVHS